MVPVNYEDEASLVEALKGQDVLLNCLSVATPSETERRMIDAAAVAGVQWVVPKEQRSGALISHQTHKSDRHIGSLPLDRTLVLICGRAGPVSVWCWLPGNPAVHREQGMFWAAQCSSFWYEHSLVSPQCFGFELEKKRVTFFDDGTTRVTATTWDQRARAIASRLSLPLESNEIAHLMQWKNRQHYCSSFYVSQRDVLES